MCESEEIFRKFQILGYWNFLKIMRRGSHELDDFFPLSLFNGILKLNDDFGHFKSATFLSQMISIVLKQIVMCW